MSCVPHPHSLHRCQLQKTAHVCWPEADQQDSSLLKCRMQTNQELHSFAQVGSVFPTSLESAPCEICRLPCHYPNQGRGLEHQEGSLCFVPAGMNPASAMHETPLHATGIRIGVGGCIISQGQARNQTVDLIRQSLHLPNLLNCMRSPSQPRSKHLTCNI